MTALLTLERAEPGDVFRAADYRAGAIESKIGLRRGERMRVQDLLVALLLESANDAAVTLAEGVAGSRGEFVELMNERARELGLDETSYANPVGFDDPDNHSSAGDLAELARVLMRNRRFAEIVDRPEATLRSGARRRTIANRNRLVRTWPFVDGVKTGHTSSAGYVLVGSASRRGAQVISVVLGTPSEAARDAESLELLDWGLDRFRRVRPVRRGRALAHAAVKHFGDRRVALEADRTITLTVRRGAKVTTRVDAPGELEGPLEANERVGTVVVLVNGRPAGRAPLVTGADVPEASFVRRSRSGLGWAVAFLVLTVAAVAAVRYRGSRSRRSGEVSA
jgi:D-alanyl-D-alanine carboxypeptidase (penicillin-binding protein 5/6)